MKLPTWTRTESTQRWCEELPGGEPGKIGPSGEKWIETIVTYQCDDPTEMAFRSRCMMQGFNLPEFDTWLATHPESEGKRQQLQRRARAKAAPTYWELRAHLEVLNASREHVDRVDGIKPLAAEGEKIRETRTRAADTTNRKAEAVNAKRNELLAKRARRLILANEATPRTVSRVLIEQDQAAGLGAKAVRDILKKAGVR